MCGVCVSVLSVSVFCACVEQWNGKLKPMPMLLSACCRRLALSQVQESEHQRGGGDSQVLHHLLHLPRAPCLTLP